MKARIILWSRKLMHLLLLMSVNKMIENKLKAEIIESKKPISNKNINDPKKMKDTKTEDEKINFDK